jgi:molecular chaperone GrpE
MRKEETLNQQAEVAESDIESVDGQASAASVEELAAERDALMDQLQRSVAEFQNFRRRTEQDRLKMRQLATHDVMQSILPLLDDLSRAIANIPDEQLNSGLGEGLKAIERKFLGILERNGVAPVGAVGEPFDPAFHEAVAADESGDRSVIVEVYQTGYRHGDSVLRPAMVKVGGPVTFNA